MHIITRAQTGLGARPRPLTKVAQHPYIEVHHSVYPASWTGEAQAKAIEKQHLGQGWNGAFYTVGIHPSGQLFELRGIGYRSIGGHKTTYNDGSKVDANALCAVLFGNYEHTPMSGAQRKTLDKLRGLVPDKRLRWHSMRAATACPGRLATPVLQEMNRTNPNPKPPVKEPPMAWIIRSKDLSGAERNALTDGVTRREFVSPAVMNEVRNQLGLDTVNVSWETWLHQFVDSRKLDQLAALPRAATAAEVVAATQTVVDDIIAALEGLTVDGEIATGQDARKLLLELLGAAA